jgi:uncharacterized RDD family membrane protein YckC
VIYAGFWRRALAILVDFAIFIPIIAVYLVVEPISIPLAIVSRVVMTGLGCAYAVYFLARWGQTIGKMVASIG